MAIGIATVESSMCHAWVPKRRLTCGQNPAHGKREHVNGNNHEKSETMMTTANSHVNDCSDFGRVGKASGRKLQGRWRGMLERGSRKTYRENVQLGARRTTSQDSQ